MASSTSSPQDFVEYQHEREKSITSSKLYDAFISHRGPDVKDTLAKQLYELLKARDCRAFLDRDEIDGGDSIPFAIRNGICSSVVQIAIFSKGYAMSSWCLNELLLMLEQTDALFIPVFYDVEPWELRDIENEKSAYAAAFFDFKSKGRNLDKLDEWKKALRSASYFSGYELSQHKDNICEKIVSRVVQVVQETKQRIPLHVAEYPVGLAELVQNFERACSHRVNDKVKIVGIYGLGGSGKTTLAKELFNIKRSGYNSSCFLPDVRESHAKGELHYLQSQLSKDLFHDNRMFRNIDEGIGQLEHRLTRARHLHFLIVLDDIDHREQLCALLFEGMLSPGSLVIVTTRDQSVLTGADITIRYRMKGMDRAHAKELFCSHAFRRHEPPFEYKKLVESFVKFCGGLPLSLKVLGAHVYGRDEYYWELELEKVKKIQPEDIMQRLKISFDGLDREEKQIFLDIACLFNKKKIVSIKSVAISIWNASGWSAEHAIQTLQDKCLVEVRGLYSPHFEMHDHLRDLGRQMAEDLGPPRLWKPDRLRSMEAKGFKQILAETKGRCLHSFEDSSLRTKITYFIGCLIDSAETELLWLDIYNEGGNLKSIPSWIPLRKLRCFQVWNVEELWSNFKQQMQTNTQASFELRMLKIVGSPSLQSFPDLIGMFNHLEELYIERSLEKTAITSFVQSLKQLGNLRSLELSGDGVSFSGNLNLSKGRHSSNFELSTSSRMNSLESMGVFNFANISKLLIHGEICPRLRSLKVEEMGNLNEMDLKQLVRLNTLEVSRCPKLETISGLSSLTGLQSLKVWECPQLETISGLSSLTGLQLLCTYQCEGLKSLPTIAHLRRLERIRVSDCHQLQSIEGLEELQRLKCLVIAVPDNGDASVWNCIYRLRRLPSEYILLRGRAVDGASSRLNVNLFSEVIGAQAIAEIQREERMRFSPLEIERGSSWLEMSSQPGAITVYALILRGKVSSIRSRLNLVRLNEFGHFRLLPLKIGYQGEWVCIALFPAHYSSYLGLWGVTIEKGFKATVKKGEEAKALTLLQRIVNILI